MMEGEKSGGHGERCIAVGALDMAMWDLAAKTVDQPLFQFLTDTFCIIKNTADVPVYGGGGYLFPDNDLVRLKDEIQYFSDLGLEAVKIKVGSIALADDLKRVETALAAVSVGKNLAVDAMNSYSSTAAIDVANSLKNYDLKWFEDICDPLDYKTHQDVINMYAPPVSAGEALFSPSDARNL